MAKESQVSATLPDLQIFNCKVCHKSLTIPVFQCKNGHAACKTCCERLEKKCATCELEIDSQCFHLEEMLRSFKLCKNKVHGCTSLISSCNATDHENNCVYECYPCPKPGCQFRGLSSQLTDHYHCFGNHHSYTTISYNSKFDLKLRKDEKIYVLREYRSQDVFVVRNETATCDGVNNISVSFVSPTPGISRKVVEVKLIAGTNVLNFYALIPTARSISDESQPPALLIIPTKALGLEVSFSISLIMRPFPELVGCVLVDAEKMLEREKEKVEDILETVQKHVPKYIWDKINR